MIIDIEGKVVNLETVLLKGIIQGKELEADLFQRDEEISRYKQMLQKYVPNYFSDKEITLLNVGCGICLEANVLYDHFKTGDNSVKLVGIDMHAEAIEYAQQQYASFGENMIFVCGDARELDWFVQDTVNIVVMSHPEIVYSNGNWRKIVDNARNIHVKGRLLLNTFYFEPEMDAMHKLIEEDYEIIFKGRNEYAKEVVSFFCPHQYLIVARKK